MTWGFTAMQEEARAQEEPGVDEQPVVTLADARDVVAEFYADLAAAESPEDRLAALADLAEAAADLSAAGEEFTGLAGECLDEAIPGLRQVRTEFPTDSEEGLVALYLLANAGLLRDARLDLDDAIGRLRDLRDLLPADDPDQGQVELELAQALIERSQRHGFGADLGEIVTLLTRGLTWVEEADPRRALLVTSLALYQATRYFGFGGSAEDRDAALSQAAAGLTAAGATAETVALCHLVTAWMVLGRQLSSAHRSTWINPGRIEKARKGGPEAAELLASLAETVIDADDAETALSELRRVRETADLQRRPARDGRHHRMPGLNESSAGRPAHQ